MSDESTTTIRETLSETLQRVVGDSEPQPERATFGAELEGGKLGFSPSNFPTAPTPSAREVEAPISLEQSGPSKLAVGQHKRIHTPIGLRSKRNGPKEPHPGTRP